MNDLVCPHCHGTVSRGAKVCRGCQAEIEYGVPMVFGIGLLILSLFLGVQTASFLPELFGWVVGIGVCIVGNIWLNGVFAKRVKFKRVYKTR
ncbi:MAG: hypothetical protein ACRCT7_02885 [Shewanella sp.]